MRKDWLVEVGNPLWINTKCPHFGQKLQEKRLPRPGV
jgi:hypothetical protein